MVRSSGVGTSPKTGCADEVLSMLEVHDEGRLVCDGLTRREWLRLGGIGIGGLSLAGLLAGRGAAGSAGRPGGKAKSVIVFGLLGGPPQHETWDPKPSAPAEVRG